MYSRTPGTRTLKGNEEQFELAGIRVIGVNFSEVFWSREMKYSSSSRGIRVVRVGVDKVVLYLPKIFRGLRDINYLLCMAH